MSARASGHYARIAVLALLLPGTCIAQTQTLWLQGIGADTPLVYPHISLPGATGIDFSLDIGLSPLYPDTESHTLIVVFEWGPTATGPWIASPDHVNTVPGGTTDFFSTGVFHGPDDADFVRLHFYAGGLMIASGPFNHISVVPEPKAAALMASGIAALGLLGMMRRRGSAMY